jgi:chromosome segregation ATPase
MFEDGMMVLETRMKNLRWDVQEDIEKIEDKIDTSNVLVDKSLNEIDELRDVVRLMRRRLDGQEEEIEALRARLTEAEDLIQELSNPDPAGNFYFFYS